MSKNFADIRKQVLGGSNRFQLLDTELCESKLYQASARFAAISGDHIARTLFLNNLILFMMSQESDPEMQAYVENYALRTIQYGRYAVFRTHATDMYALSYTVLHPDSTQITLRDPQSRQYLETLDFDQKMNIEFVRRLAAGTQTSSMATRYLYRLEIQLRIRDGRYRLWRREAAIWAQVTPEMKAKILRSMQTEANRLGSGTVRNAELVKQGLDKLAKKYINTTNKVPESTEPELVEQPEPGPLAQLNQRWCKT